MYKPPPSRLPKPKPVANIWPALQRSSHSPPPQPRHIVETAFRHQSRSSTPAKSLRTFLQKSFAPDKWSMRNVEEDKRSRKAKRPSLTQFVPIPQVMRRRTSTETSETTMELKGGSVRSMHSAARASLNRTHGFMHEGQSITFEADPWHDLHHRHHFHAPSHDHSRRHRHSSADMNMVAASALERSVSHGSLAASPWVYDRCSASFLEDGVPLDRSHRGGHPVARWLLRNDATHEPHHRCGTDMDRLGCSSDRHSMHHERPALVDVHRYVPTTRHQSLLQASLPTSKRCANSTPGWISSAAGHLSRVRQSTTALVAECRAAVNQVARRN
ncbi:hypothetical protein AAVH_37226 [Aphelenchoides avenae]|nr:hypothetical protein AAVH_37226 [Aphelenchus avenae]